MWKKYFMKIDDDGCRVDINQVAAYWLSHNPEGTVHLTLNSGFVMATSFTNIQEFEARLREVILCSSPQSSS